MHVDQEHLLVSRWEGVSKLPTTPFQQTILGVTVSLTVLCFLMFLMRLYSRLLTKQYGLGMWEFLLCLRPPLAARVSPAT